jgi:restriction endonuclease S subunit
MSELLQTIRFRDCSIWSVAYLLESQFNYNQDYDLVRIGDFLTRNKTPVIIQDDVVYKRVTIRLYNKGVVLRDKVYGKNIGTKKQYLIKKGQFLLSKIDARNGAFGLATKEVDGAIITADFFAYDIDTTKIEPLFLVLMTTTKKFMQFAQSASSGTTGRQRIDEKKFLDVKIPLPPLEKQKEIVQAYQYRIDLAKEQEEEAKDREKEIEEYLYKELGIVENDNTKNTLLNFTHFNELSSWSYKDIFDGVKIKSLKYNVIKLSQYPALYTDLFRGKSPKYDLKSDYLILNQKCIRWNYIELKYSKSVQKEWFLKIDQKFFTKEGDILINSTGDGTIGRSTLVTKDYINLIYDSHILLLRVNKEEVNPSYLVEYINSSLGQSQIENIKSAVATKQTELGLGNLKNIQIVLPKLEIQNQIADYITKQKNKIDTLKEEAEKNKYLALQEFEREIFLTESEEVGA